MNIIWEAMNLIWGYEFLEVWCWLKMGLDQTGPIREGLGDSHMTVVRHVRGITDREKLIRIVQTKRQIRTEPIWLPRNATKLLATVWYQTVNQICYTCSQSVRSKTCLEHAIMKCLSLIGQCEGSKSLRTEQEPIWLPRNATEHFGNGSVPNCKSDVYQFYSSVIPVHDLFYKNRSKTCSAYICGSPG